MASDRWAVLVEGLGEEIDRLGNLSAVNRRNIARAINKITRDGRVEIARDIRAQVNFPASYLSPSDKRLYVSKQATPQTLEGRITARARATMLARFVQGSPTTGEGVTVEVQPGKARRLKRAFLIKLPQGRSPITDTKFNLALAVRLRPGDTLRNKKSARMLSKGLYILYGPSVDQVFRAADGSGVATDRAPQLAKDLSVEYLRLMRLSDV